MTEDSALAKRFRASGLTFLGKTNVPEFTLLPTTESALYGPARNPWNVEHSTGGSSGGAGAAVAAGIVPLAHANDSGGSIRIPASSCGLVGLKPTRGRSPFGPHYGDVLSGLCHEHVVTRTVRDSAAMLDCIHGNEPGDPYVAPPVERPFLDETKRKPGKLRIAFSKTNPAGAALHPDCVKGVEEVAKCLAELGHDVSEAMPPLKADEPGNIFLPMWGAWLASEIEGEAARIGRGPQQGDLEPLTQGLYEVGKQVTSAQYLMLVKEMQGLARRVAGFMQDYDVWLTPTLALPPIPLGLININEPARLERLRARRRLCALHADPEPDGPACPVAAAFDVRRGTSHRHDVFRALRRRGDAVPSCRPTRGSDALEGSASGCLELTRHKRDQRGEKR